MSWTLGNVVEATNVSGTSPSVTLTGVPANATIVFAFQTGSTISGAPNDGSNYTQIGTSVSSSGQQSSIWYLTSAAAGSHTIAAPVASSGFSNTLQACWFLNGPSSLDATAQQDSNFAGTAANAITSTAATTANNGDLILGITLGASGGGAMTAGTSPNAFSAISGTSRTTVLWEYFVQTSAGSVAATFTSASSGDFQTFMVALAARYATSNGSSAGTGTANPVPNAIASGGAQTAGVANAQIVAANVQQAAVLAQGTAHAPARAAISSVNAVGAMTGVGASYSGVQGYALSQGVATVTGVAGNQPSAAAALSIGISTVRANTPDVVVMGATAVQQGAAAYAQGIAAVTAASGTGNSPILVPAAASAIAAAVVTGAAVANGGIQAAGAYSIGKSTVLGRTPVKVNPIVKRDGVRVRREASDALTEQDQAEIAQIIPLLVAHIAKFEARPR